MGENCAPTRLSSRWNSCIWLAGCGGELSVLHVWKLPPEVNKMVPSVNSSFAGPLQRDQFWCIYSLREAHNGSSLKISFQLDNRLVKRGGSRGHCFHTFLWFHISVTRTMYCFSLNTSISRFCSRNQIQFAPGTVMSRTTILLDHTEALLNEILSHIIKSNQIMSLFSFNFTAQCIKDKFQSKQNCFVSFRPSTHPSIYRRVQLAEI